jgi:hypothetical protein
VSQAPTAKQALEQAAANKQRVRIFYGDPVTGTDDCDETERMGMPRKTKAGAFLFTIRKGDEAHNAWIHTIDTSRVVRIASYVRRSPLGKTVELYRHPNYTAGEWSHYYRSDLGRWVAVRSGLIHATFDNEIDAAIYVDYIQGNRARTRYPDKAAAFKRLVERKANS